MRFRIAAAVLMFTCHGVRAAVLEVPGEYATISAAVDAAGATGDTVRVAPGEYPEDVLVDSKEIVLLGGEGGVTRAASFSFTTLPGIEHPSGGWVSGFSVTGSFTADHLHRSFTMERCAIDGPVQLEAHAGGEHLCIGNSQFGSSLVIWGTMDPSSEVIVDSCTVEGSFECYGDDPYIFDSRVEGDALAYGASACDVDGCFFLTGLAAAGGIFGTVVSGCAIQGGLEFWNGEYEAWAVDNEVSGGDLDISGSDCVVLRNVVRGGVRGIHVTAQGDFRIEQNTVVGCSQSGIQCDGGTVAEFTRNIVKGNAVGVVVPAGSPPSAFTCNDVYDNAGGDWVGVADPSGTLGNFSLDPVFCNELEGNLRLSASSPCLAGNHPDGAQCGRIGALDQGCGFTSNLTSAFPAVRPHLRVLGANPTRGSARIAVTLPAPARVSLEMIDSSGREVATVGGAWLDAGRHELQWDGRSRSGDLVASGVYFVCLRGTREARPLRLVVLR